MKHKKKKNKKPDDDNEKSEKTILKTLVVDYKFSKNEFAIIDFMSQISKNVYNATIFCFSIFQMYRCNIYEEVYNFVKLMHAKKKNPEDKLDITVIDRQIQTVFETKYNNYCKIKSDIKNNNELIYKYIIDKIKNENIYLDNDNFYEFYKRMEFKLKKNEDMKLDGDNDDDLFYSIVKRICRSIYTRNFCTVKYNLLNKIPIENASEKFINQVKQDMFLFKDDKSSPDYKTKIKNDFDIELKSNRNYITRYIYKHLGTNIDMLPSDIIINIIDKSLQSINSFYALKEKGIKCNMPKYLQSSDRFNLMFFDRSRKELNNGNIRLTVGKYVANNYLDITKDKNLICVNKDQSSDYKKYVISSSKKKINDGDKIKKSDNFMFDDLDDPSIKYYISKKSSLLNAYYVSINKPKKLNGKKIKMVEIVPLYNGYKYQIHYKYEETIKNQETQKQSTEKQVPNIKDFISVDLGIKNLMVIYDPDGEPRIISGTWLIYQNSLYNTKIDILKSKAKKCNNKNTTNQIRQLLIERQNKINNYFNLIVKWFANNYKTKKIVIGYNINWKKGTNMGKTNNRTFYEIPFTKLLNKLKFKMSLLGSEVILNEESYTSKCDSLALEDIKKQEEYLGKRTKRGLFSSAIGKLINADLNGAINILRKYLKKKNVEISAISGHSLFNPKRINVYHEVIRKFSVTSGNPTN